MRPRATGVSKIYSSSCINNKQLDANIYCYKESSNCPDLASRMTLYLKTLDCVKTQMVPDTGSLHMLSSFPKRCNKSDFFLNFAIIKQ